MLSVYGAVNSTTCVLAEEKVNRVMFLVIACSNKKAPRENGTGLCISFIKYIPYLKSEI